MDTQTDVELAYSISDVMMKHCAGQDDTSVNPKDMLQMPLHPTQSGVKETECLHSQRAEAKLRHEGSNWMSPFHECWRSRPPRAGSEQWVLTDCAMKEENGQVVNPLRL